MLGLLQKIGSIGLSIVVGIAVCRTSSLGSPVNCGTDINLSTRIHLQRTGKIGKATTGTLLLPDGRVLHTLEPIRPISAGIYKIKRFWSYKHNREGLKLVAVPGYSDITLEIGNTPQDTRGCVLVGLEARGDRVLRSKEAFEILMSLTDSYKIAEIEISDPPSAVPSK